jgi:hypothetical protein
MVGSTFYVATRRNQESLVLPVCILAHWSDFVMIEGLYPSGEEYVAVVKTDKLFRSEQGAMKSVA